MSTVEDHGMSAAEKDHDAEQRAFAAAWEARRKPSPSIMQTRAADDDAIKEAMYDAICDGEGHSNAFYLKHHLAKHGLVIVEASKYDHAKIALQVIGSFPITLPAENMDAFNMAKVASDAIKKMEA
jgi:hypothetical protein